MNTETADPSLVAFAEALTPLILAALRPFGDADPKACAAVLDAYGRGDVRFVLTTVSGRGVPLEHRLAAVDLHGNSRLIATLSTPASGLN